MISDIHIDYDYMEGASNDCGRPLCCRSDSGMAKEDSKKAGKWGDYNCDIPSRTLDSMLNHIRENIQPNAVFWNGDSVPHNIETLNLDTNVDIIKNVTTQVKKGLDGLKIYPVIGNHDTYP